MSDDRNELSFEAIVDQCIDGIATGQLSLEEALARWPEHRDELAPLLETMFAVRELPSVPARAPDPERRAALMEAIATTPQEAPAAAASGPRDLGNRVAAWLSGLGGSARIAAIAGPAAAIALVAVFVTFAGGADRASASTLTVFEGAVERFEDGEWAPADDGVSLDEGERLRTTADGAALLTFPDGSTAALAPGTELVLERIAADDAREITIEQLSGRVWNDVAPAGDSMSYVVRTADARVVARGTTFETAIVDGVTSVTGASGEVEVDAGADRATALAGDVVRADAEQIVDARPHASAGAPVTIAIDGPFVGSLQAANGAATGALPSGVTYQQIPGVSTSDPGDGPQLLRFYDVAPGPYTLVLRRIDGTGTGRVVLANGEVRRAIELPADLGTMRLQVDIGVSEVDGRIALSLVDREVEAIDEPAATERIVDTPRTTDAVAVSDRRAAATATPTDAVRPSATAVTDRAPSETATPVPDRLLAILDLAAPARAAELRTFLVEVGRDAPRWAELRRRIEGDAVLRERFLAALLETGDAAFIDSVRAELGLAEPVRDTVTPTATPSDRPTETATPSGTPSDEATRDTR